MVKYQHLGDSHLILGCATAPPVSLEWSQLWPGLLTPAPFNSPCWHHFSTQPSSASHRQQQHQTNPDFPLAGKSPGPDTT